MKINLLLSLFAALFMALSIPSLSAASSAAITSFPAVSAVQAEAKSGGTTHFKKEKRQSRLKKWWAKQASKLQKMKKWVQRISLGFAGFLVMLVGGLFILLGIVIPVVGILFLVIGIIIAFVGLLLWIFLSKVGVRVQSGNGQQRHAN